MSAQKISTILFAAGSILLASISSVHAQSTPKGMEKCYGVSLAGQDDGTDSGGPIPGMSTKDYQGDAYKYVSEGKCETIVTPNGNGSKAPVK